MRDNSAQHAADSSLAKQLRSFDHVLRHGGYLPHVCAELAGLQDSNTGAGDQDGARAHQDLARSGRDSQAQVHRLVPFHLVRHVRQHHSHYDHGSLHSTKVPRIRSGDSEHYLRLCVWTQLDRVRFDDRSPCKHFNYILTYDYLFSMQRYILILPKMKQCEKESVSQLQLHASLSSLRNRHVCHLLHHKHLRVLLHHLHIQCIRRIIPVFANTNGVRNSRVEPLRQPGARLR